jgi:hypothetical protein
MPFLKAVSKRLENIKRGWRYKQKPLEEDVGEGLASKGLGE